MAQLLEVLGEELRVAEEEIRAQHDLTEGRPRGRSGEWLAHPGLAAALPIAMLETDSNGLVVRANPAAAALFRVENCHLRGKPLAAMVEPADRRVPRTALANATRRRAGGAAGPGCPDSPLDGLPERDGPPGVHIGRMPREVPASAKTPLGCSRTP